MRFNVENLVPDDFMFTLDLDAYLRIMRTNLLPDIRISFCDLEITKGTSESVSSFWQDAMKLHFKEIVKDEIGYDQFLQSWIAGNRTFNYSIDVLDFEEKLHTMYFPHGLVLIGGLSMLGKSTFMRNLNSNFGGEYIIYGEPDYPSITSRDELAEKLHEFLESDDRVLFIDSISEFFVATGKVAAAAGGINNLLLSEFPKFSNALAMLGKTVIAAINYGDKNDRVNDLHVAYAGKVAMYIAWNGLGSGSYSNRVTRRRKDEKFFVPSSISNMKKTSIDSKNKNKQGGDISSIKVDTNFSKLEYAFTL